MNVERLTNRTMSVYEDVEKGVFTNEQLNKDFQKWWNDCYEDGDDGESLFYEYMQYLYDSKIICLETFLGARYIK